MLWRRLASGLYVRRIVWEWVQGRVVNSMRPCRSLSELVDLTEAMCILLGVDRSKYMSSRCYEFCLNSLFKILYSVVSGAGIA
jgi:hypothetical protein